MKQFKRILASIVLAMAMVVTATPVVDVQTVVAAQKLSFPKKIRITEDTEKHTLKVKGLRKKQSVKFKLDSGASQCLGYEKHKKSIDIYGYDDGSGKIKAVVSTKGKKNKKILTCIITVKLSQSDEDDDNNNNNSNENSILPQYISSRSASTDSSNKRVRVFFKLLDKNEKEMKASGTATVQLSDDQGNLLYTGDIPFSESDFSTYSNRLGTNFGLLCELDIPYTSLKVSSSSTGTCTLSVVADKMRFDEYQMTITGLPGLSELSGNDAVKINLPQSKPVKNGTASDFSYTIEKDYTDNSKVNVKVSFIAQYNYDGTASKHYVSSNFRLISVDTGIVESTSSFIKAGLSEGEKVRCEMIFYDVPAGTYNLQS